MKTELDISEVDGVTRIKISIPFDVKFVSAYIFKINGERILIDAGFNTLAWRKRFLEALNQLNLTIKDLDYCFVSHEHLDHCGLLKYLKRKNPNMQILMHEISDISLNFGSNPDFHETMEKNAIKVAEELVAYGMERDLINRLMKSFLIWPKIVRYQKPDKLLADDDEVNISGTKLKIIWTPGHSLGHICVFNTKNGHFFSGDHILSRITPHIGIYHISTLIDDKLSNPNVLEIYLKSLDKILDLKPKIIFPGHQEIIRNPIERILEIKEHHQTRFKEICSLIENEPLTAYKISRVHFGSDLDDMNTYLAINEILSHLIYMEGKEKVKRIEKDGLFYFKAN